MMLVEAEKHEGDNARREVNLHHEPVRSVIHNCHLG